MRQAVWQFANCELHDIMQFVTVEVTGVESPWKGGVVFGTVGKGGMKVWGVPSKGGGAALGIVACASATSCALK